MAQSEDIGHVIHSLNTAVADLVEFVSRSGAHKQQALLCADELLEASMKLNNAMFYVGIRPEEKA